MAYRKVLKLTERQRLTCEREIVGCTREREIVGLKCVYISYINYSRKLPKVFISPTASILKQ